MDEDFKRHLQRHRRLRKQLLKRLDEPRAQMMLLTQGIDPVVIEAALEFLRSPISDAEVDMVRRTYDKQRST